MKKNVFASEFKGVCTRCKRHVFGRLLRALAGDRVIGSKGAAHPVSQAKITGGVVRFVERVRECQNR